MKKLRKWLILIKLPVLYVIYQVKITKGTENKNEDVFSNDGR